MLLFICVKYQTDTFLQAVEIDFCMIEYVQNFTRGVFTYLSCPLLLHLSVCGMYIRMDSKTRKPFSPKGRKKFTQKVNGEVPNLHDSPRLFSVHF